MLARIELELGGERVRDEQRRRDAQRVPGAGDGRDLAGESTAYSMSCPESAT